jgi:hypothetical protein
LRQLAQHLALALPGVADGGIHRGAGNAVAQRDVAIAVRRDAAHPAMQGVVGDVDAFLVDEGRAAGVAHLVPLGHGTAVYVYRVVGEEGFVRTIVAVLQEVHQPEA